MLKRRILFSMMFVLVFALIAACGNGDDPADDTAQATPTPTPAAQADPAAQDDDPEPVEELPAIDMEGRTIMFVASFAPHQVRTDAPPPDPGVGARGFFYDNMMWEHLQFMRDRYNVSFDFMVRPWGEMLPMLTVEVLAGAPEGDFYFQEGAFTFAAINGDLIYPINDIADPDADIFGPRLRVMPAAEFANRIWTVHRREPNLGPQFIGVNLDIINAIGAPNPADLYERGEWTFDAFLEIARLATRDTTGDGIIDQFGISGVPGEIVQHLVAANAGYMVVPTDFSFGFTHPNTLHALEFAQTIFEEGLWQYLGEDAFWDWTSNFNAYVQGNAAMFPVATWSLYAQRDNIPFEYTAVPWPQGPNNPQGFSFLEAFMNGWAIPRGVEDPGMVYHMFELMNSWHGDDPEIADGQPIEVVRGLFRTEEEVQRVINFMTRRRPDLGMSVMAEDGWALSWVFGSLAWSFHYGGDSIATIIEEIRPLAEATIEDNFGRWR